MNRKNTIISAVVGVSVLVGAYFVASPLWTTYQHSKVDPAVVLAESLDQMANLNSYRYDLHSEFTVKEQTRVISDISGEYTEGRVHITGEMVNTPVDVYFIDGVIYNYDAQAEKWMVIESKGTTSAALLISELNPMAYLGYKELPIWQNADFAEVDGKDCLVIELFPQLEQQLLQEMWQDFEGKLWLDYKANTIKILELSAANKNNPATKLMVHLNFKDFDAKISITEPDITAPKTK